MEKLALAFVSLIALACCGDEQKPPATRRKVKADPPPCICPLWEIEPGETSSLYYCDQWDPDCEYYSDGFFPAEPGLPYGTCQENDCDANCFAPARAGVNARKTIERRAKLPNKVDDDFEPEFQGASGPVYHRFVRFKKSDGTTVRARVLLYEIAGLRRLVGVGYQVKDTGGAWTIADKYVKPLSAWEYRVQLGGASFDVLTTHDE